MQQITITLTLPTKYLFLEDLQKRLGRDTTLREKEEWEQSLPVLLTRFCERSIKEVASQEHTYSRLIENIVTCDWSPDEEKELIDDYFSNRKRKMLKEIEKEIEKDRVLIKHETSPYDAKNEWGK